MDSIGGAFFDLSALAVRYAQSRSQGRPLRTGLLEASEIINAGK
jgi:hypothetical protein